MVPSYLTNILFLLCAICISSIAKADSDIYTLQDGKLIIKDGVTEIKVDDLKDVEYSSVELPASVHTIEDMALISSVDTYIQSIIGNGSSKSGMTINNQSTGLLLYANGTKCYGWIGNKDSCPSKLYIPEGVRFINGNSFFRFGKLEEVVLPKSLKSIGNKAFAQCKNLKTVVLPQQLDTIGKWCFESCYELKDINIPKGCKLMEGAFKDCDSLNFLMLSDHGTVCMGWTNKNYAGSIVIPEGVTTIAPNAFEGCSSIKKIVLPEGLDSIGSEAFAGCMSIEEMWMPNSVRRIGGYGIFRDCIRLKSIHLSDSLPKIAEFMFEDCGELKTIVIPNTVTTIGSGAFCNCSSLKSLILPDQVEKIKDNTFVGCDSLEYIKWPSALTTISSCAFSKNSKFVVPKDVTVEQGFNCREGSEYFDSYDTMGFVPLVVFLFLLELLFLKCGLSYSWSKSLAISFFSIISIGLILFICFVVFMSIIFGNYHG